MGQKIAVELSIDNSFAFSIPVDSKIEVKSEGLIGSKFISITPGFNTKDFILPDETVEGLREFDFSEITPGIVPLTQDLSAFARRLKATLGEEEKDKIRLVIQKISRHNKFGSRCFRQVRIYSEVLINHLTVDISAILFLRQHTGREF